MPQKVSMPRFDVETIACTILDEVRGGRRAPSDRRNAQETRLPHLSCEPRIADKSSYHRDDFLAYCEPETFIRNCYRGILKQEVDDAGLEYYQNLMQTKGRSPIEILGRIRYSRLGRSKAVPVVGLTVPCVIDQVCRVPIVGTLLRVGVTTANLPNALRRLRESLAAVEWKLRDQAARVDSVIDGIEVELNRQAFQIEAKVDVATIDLLRTEMERKAEQDAVGELRHDLHGKADKDSVRALREDVEGKADEGTLRELRYDLDGKADWHSIEKLNEEIGKLAPAESLDALVEQLEKKENKGSLGVLRQELDGKADWTSAKNSEKALATLTCRLDQHRLEILDYQSQLRSWIGTLGPHSDRNMPPLATVDDVKANTGRWDPLLAMHARVFRESGEALEDKLKVYLDHMTSVPSRSDSDWVLDIGCGGGEWLSLLTQHGYRCRGVEANHVLAKRCEEAGLDVTRAEALPFMRELADKQMAVVTAFHVVEHLEASELLDMLAETSRLLRPGGLAIFETPNPANLWVSTFDFYLDPTHRRPLPAPLLKFFVEACGLTDTETIFLHPRGELPDELALDLPDELRRAFMGPQDYALVARKPATCAF